MPLRSARSRNRAGKGLRPIGLVTTCLRPPASAGQTDWRWR
jgi:hypothetical protein